MGRIYDYKVNYSKYLELRKERREQQQKAYEEQQKFIAETKDFIERFKGTYSKTLQVQSRVKMLEKLEILEVDEEDTSALRLKFPPSPRSGNYPVIMDGVGKSYGDKVVFRNATLTVERGDKVAFVGKNGEGKSTLVKLLAGAYEAANAAGVTADAGTIKWADKAQVGYYAQDHESDFDTDMNLTEWMRQWTQEGDDEQVVRGTLGRLLFGGDDVTKPVRVLSGGEKGRMLYGKLILTKPNVLIMDEPTNHMDMESIESLNMALEKYKGTLIFVSHDRQFVSSLATQILELDGKGGYEHYMGNYEDYLASRGLS